jgi:hypothetical protein
MTHRSLATQAGQGTHLGERVSTSGLRTRTFHQYLLELEEAIMDVISAKDSMRPHCDGMIKDRGSFSRLEDDRRAHRVPHAAGGRPSSWISRSSPGRPPSPSGGVGASPRRSVSTAGISPAPSAGHERSTRSSWASSSPSGASSLTRWCWPRSLRVFRAYGSISPLPDAHDGSDAPQPTSAAAPPKAVTGNRRTLTPSRTMSTRSSPPGQCPQKESHTCTGWMSQPSLA